MDYAEGGTLWEVLESTSLERIQEVSPRWWLPQVISTFAWCHPLGVVHQYVPTSYPQLSIRVHETVQKKRRETPQHCTQPCVLFLPSEGDSSPGLSALRTTPRSILREEAESFFTGLSWGPTADAIPDTTLPTPAPPAFALPHSSSSDPTIAANEFVTPKRGISTIPCASTLRRTRTAPRRAVSDRKAMRQLVDYVELSARKKVLAAGRIPRRALAETKLRTIRFATRAPELLNFALTKPSEDAVAAITRRGLKRPGQCGVRLEGHCY